jgi:hypothetical protein
MSRLHALIACAGIAVVVAGIAVAANSSSFVDRTKDTKYTPDIGRLDVSSDDAGALTFRIAFAGGITPGLPGEQLGVAIDLDQDPDTGTVYYGTDVAFELDDTTLRFFRADQNEFAAAPTPASLQGSVAGDTATFTVKAADLGLAPTDGVNVVAFSDTRLDDDLAPDIRTYNYQQVAGTQPKSLGLDTRAPFDRAFRARAVHGKVAELDYAASDGRAVTSDTIRIYRRQRLLRTIRFSLGDTNPFYVYYAKWRVPRTVRGRLRFCVRSADAAHNVSNLSCAPLRIR